MSRHLKVTLIVLAVLNRSHWPSTFRIRPRRRSGPSRMRICWMIRTLRLPCRPSLKSASQFRYCQAAVWAARSSRRKRERRERIGLGRMTIQRLSSWLSAPALCAVLTFWVGTAIAQDKGTLDPEPLPAHQNSRARYARQRAVRTQIGGIRRTGAFYRLLLQGLHRRCCGASY